MEVERFRMTQPWRIELMGTLRARQGERVVERFHSRRTGLLLAPDLASWQALHDLLLAPDTGH